MYLLYKWLGRGFRILFLLFYFFAYDYLPSGIFFIFFVIFGWCFSSWLDHHKNPFFLKDSMTEEERAEFRRCSFGLFGYIAKGRGQVIQEQLDYLENSIAGLPKEEKLILHRAFNDGKKLEPVYGCDLLCSKMLKLIHGNRHIINQFIEMCVYITLCDGVFEEEERVRIFLISRLLKVPDYVTTRFIKEQIAIASFNYFRNDRNTQNRNDRTGNKGGTNYSDAGSTKSESYNSNGSNSSYNDRQDNEQAHVYNDDYENALKVLGVTDQMSFPEIKKAYLKLMKRYHPDRLASMNVSDEMKKIYTEKSQTIQAAYDVIKEKHESK